MLDFYILCLFKIVFKVYRRRFEYEKIVAERRRGLHSKGNTFIFQLSEII